MKDRLAKYPGRVRLTPVPGEADLYDMVREDEPEIAGTPINKNTLLTDETASELGLDPSGDPTPDQAFRQLAITSGAKTGDIKETMRTNIGSDWLLCNGDVLPEKEFPALWDVLPYSTDWRRVAQFYKYAEVRPLQTPGKWLFYNEYNRYQKNNNMAVMLYDAETDVCHDIACPSIETDEIYGIFGMCYINDQYVLGVGVSSAEIRLYTSQDLTTWVLAYTIGASSGAAGSQSPYDIISTGEEILVALSYYNTSNMYETTLYAISKDFASHTKRMDFDSSSRYKLYSYPGGYWGYEVPGFRMYIYPSGSSTFVMAHVDGNPCLAFLSDRYWLCVPETDGETWTYLIICDVQNLQVTKKDVTSLFRDMPQSALLHGVSYDRNTKNWAFYLSYKKAYGEAEKYYTAIISEQADPTDVSSYTLVQVEALPENMAYGQMSHDRARLMIETENNYYLNDPNQKYLPYHDGDTYKYIYAGGHVGGDDTDSGLLITDDGNGNVTIQMSDDAYITDDGSGNVTITVPDGVSITDDGNGNVIIA